MDRRSNAAPLTFSAAADSLLQVSQNPFAAADDGAPRAAVDAVWSQDVDCDDDDDVVRPEAVDVRILWGTNVLHFAQLCPPRPFILGGTGSDFTPPSEGGSDRSFALVVLRGSRPCVVLRAGATGHAKLANGKTLSILQCVAEGLAVRSSEGGGAYDLILPVGTIATVGLPGSDLLFEIARVRAGRKLQAGFLGGAELSSQLYFGMSALAHGALLGALAFFLPAMHGDDAESVDHDTAAAMRPYLEAIAEKEPEHAEAAAALEASMPSGGGQGSQAAGPSGAAGNPITTAAHAGRSAMKGDVRDSRLAREHALVDAATFGLVGILNTDAPRGADTLSAAWAAEPAGPAAKNALGSMWAESIDDAWAPGGLGLSGTDQGGGGLARGVGIDGIDDTVGHGTGDLGDGPIRGPGHHFGPGGVGHPRGGLADCRPHAPSVRPSPLTTFSGRLPQEIVQRIVRQNFGRFRLCYEAGLRGNPGLTGRVAVAFVIDQTGAVAVAAADRSTDMADPNVVSCVVRGFQNLSFPAPANGTVQVVYPLMLAPGD